MRLQIQTLAKARIITCVSNAMEAVLRDQIKLDIPVYTLLNAFDDDQGTFRNFTSVQNQQMVFLYTGRLYEGYQDFHPFFRAILSLKEKLFNLPSFSIWYAGQSGPIFYRQAESYNLCDYVKDLGMLPRKKALELQRQADILLLSIGTGRDDEAMVLTGKVFEYLAARKPIFALGNTKGDLGRLLKQTRAGYIYRPDQLEEITSKLAEWFMAFSKTGTVPYEGVDEEIQKHSWSNRVDELVAIIQDLRNGRA